MGGAVPPPLIRDLRPVPDLPDRHGLVAAFRENRDPQGMESAAYGPKRVVFRQGFVGSAPKGLLPPMLQPTFQQPYKPAYEASAPPRGSSHLQKSSPLKSERTRTSWAK